MNYLMFKAVLQSMQYERSKNQEAPASLFFQRTGIKGLQASQ
jgi:hypothetical protein